MRSLISILMASAMTAGATPTPTDIRQSAAASNRFGVELFRQLQESHADQNIFFSPVSASQALTLLLAGSRDRTYAELARSMGLDARRDLRSHLAAAAAGIEVLTQNDDADRGLVFRSANALFGSSRDFAFKPSYLQAVQGVLKSQAETLDFEHDDSASVINAWVREQTQGKISKVVDAETLKDLKTLIVNASYFKGDWAQPFAAENTRPETFTTATSRHEVPMMKTPAEGLLARMVESPDYQAIEVNYASASAGRATASMIILKPARYETFVSSLNFQKLNAAIEQTQSATPQAVALSLPKFSLSVEYDLIPSLQAVGLREVFSDRADFSSISDTDLSVGLVKQKTFVAVDEKGTEAAAATTIGAGATSVMPAAKREMKVNSPFIVVIKSNQTGAFLFVGLVVDPAQS